MRAVFWNLLLIGACVGTSPGAQEIATFRSAIIALVEDSTVRMALENPRWGYTRIRGALMNLGHEIG